MKNSEHEPKRATVEEPHATDPKFPFLIQTPDLQMTCLAALTREPSCAVVVRVDTLLTRISISIEGRSGYSGAASEEQIRLEMSPKAAEELGTQLLYARDKLTGRR